MPFQAQFCVSGRYWAGRGRGGGAHRSWWSRGGPGISARVLRGKEEELWLPSEEAAGQLGGSEQEAPLCLTIAKSEPGKGAGYLTKGTEVLRPRSQRAGVSRGLQTEGRAVRPRAGTGQLET